MNILPEYKKINMDEWARAEHFQYYQQQIPCSYSLTVREDITELLDYAHLKGKRFIACLLHTVCEVVNEMDSMRMMVLENGEPGIWKVSHPNFTVFHRENETFSDLWMEYETDLEQFYNEYVKVIEQYGNCKGIKGRTNQPANFFCFSCIPWIDYEGYASCSADGRKPPLFPIITCGKYVKENDRYTMPITLTISHAAADGYHASMFFEKLQQKLLMFKEIIA